MKEWIDKQRGRARLSIFLNVQNGIFTHTKTGREPGLSIRYEHPRPIKLDEFATQAVNLCFDIHVVSRGEFTRQGCKWTANWIRM